MEKLFVYGSLQPGGPNEQVLAASAGTWEPAIIKGKLVERGWGANLGYPGLVFDENENDVHGYVFSSSNINWAELDEFEGEPYQRLVAPVILQSGKQVQAHVYVLRT